VNECKPLAGGAAAVVGGMVRALQRERAAGAGAGASGASLFRWQAHALRNLSVRSVAMQEAIGGRDTHTLGHTNLVLDQCELNCIA